VDHENNTIGKRKKGKQRIGRRKMGERKTENGRLKKED
jgi:hypothetical protein